jgi:hypothetical protein
MVEDRDQNGRLRVPFFVELLREYKQGNHYDPHEFKAYVERLNILTNADRECENNGYAKWKHRIDRAAQKVFTDI